MMQFNSPRGVLRLLALLLVSSTTQAQNPTLPDYHADPSARVCVERLSYNEDGTIKPVQMSKGATH
jgi:hypothetical protein